MMYETFKTAEDFEKTPVLVIVSMYNALTGKSIKGFHTRAKGIEQTLRAIAEKNGTSAPTETKAKTKTKAKTSTKAAKPTGKVGKRGRHPINRPDQIIVLQSEENHKRPNTWAQKQFARLLECNGKTVATFLAMEGKHPAMRDRRKGWAREELAYAVRRGYVTLEDAA